MAITKAEVLEQVENAKKLIKRDGHKLEYADALYKYGQYLFEVESDVEKATNTMYLAKDCIEKYIVENAGYTVWDLDKYCIDNNIEHPILTKFYEIIKLLTYVDFECFMFYMEKNRKQEERFYFPRMETLGVVAQDYMDLDKGKIKFLGVSLPARVGKSTLELFFLCWIAMKRPNSHSAMGGHSGLLVKGFYNELLNLMTSEDYTFSEIYCYWHSQYKSVIKKKSAEEYTITLGKADRFATITCRGVDGTWTGAIDVSADGYLCIDDLVRDREHSLNAQRMENTYQEYLNKMVDRKNDGAKEVMTATLWSVLDPLERMRVKYEGNPQYRFRRIPALNEKDESNFQYKFGLGFSTEYYKEVRDRLDTAEWSAKYQQKPFVREGLLFPSEELRRFDGNLVDKSLYGTIAVCDPAIGGGDNISMPICKFNPKEKKYYIVDWLYSKDSTKVTVPRMVDKVIKHSIPEIIIENDGVGVVVIKELKEEFAKRGVMCKLTQKHAPKSLKKEEKILGCCDYIKDHFYFLNETQDNSDNEYLMDSDYKRAMNDLSLYSKENNKGLHDDSADSLSMLSLNFNPISQNGAVEVPDWWKNMHI